MPTVAPRWEAIACDEVGLAAANADQTAARIVLRDGLNATAVGGDDLELLVVVNRRHGGFGSR